MYDFKKTHSTISYYGNLFPCSSKGVVEEGKGEASRLSLRLRLHALYSCGYTRDWFQVLLMEPAYEIG